MALKFRRGTTAQQSGSLAFGEPYVNTTLGTLLVGGSSSDIQLAPGGATAAIVALSVSASSFVSASSLKITGNASIDGNLTLGGNITIGDTTSDNLVVNADLSSSIIPNDDNAFDLGSSSKKYRNIYGTSIEATNVTASAQIVNGDLKISSTSPRIYLIDTDSNDDFSIKNSDGTFIVSDDSTSTDKFKIYSPSGLIEFNGSTSITNGGLIVANGITGSIAATNGVISGSSQLPAGIVSGSSQIPPILPVGSVSSSVQVDITATTGYSTFSASIATTDLEEKNRLTNLESTSASVLGHISDINTKTGSFESKFSTLSTYTASLAAQVSRIQESTASLNSFSASTLGHIGDINTKTGSFETKHSTLATYTASIDNNIANIHSYTSSLRAAITASGANVTFSGDVTVPGNLTVAGTQTTVNSTNVTIADSVLELNYGGSVVKSGILTKDGTGGSSVSGSLLWDGNLDTWVAGVSGSEAKIITDAHTPVTSSQQVVGILTSLNSFTSSIDTTIKTKLNTDTVVSSSSQLTSSFDERYLNTVGDGVYSSSAQIQGNIYSAGSSVTIQDIVVGAGTTFGKVATDGSKYISIMPTTNVESARFWANGNVTIQDAGDYIDNGYKLEVSGSTKFVGDSVITGSLAINDSATNFSIEGNGFSQAYLTSNGAIVLNPGYGGVEMVGSYRTFKATDITAEGFVSGEIRANNGVVSGSSQIKTYGDIATTGSNLFVGNQTVSGSILPATSGSYDLGSTSKPFRHIYVGTGSIYLVNPEGGQAYSISAQTIVTKDVISSGSVDLTNSLPTGSVSSSAQVVGILNPVNAYTASQDSKNSTLSTYTASLDTKNSTLSTYTASLDTKNSTLSTVTASLLSTQTNLNSYTSSLNNAIQLTGSTVSFLGNIVVYGTQSVINSQNVQISDNILYLSPSASVDNDLGIVGHYNDGTYRHAGIFMDASDGHSWKIFNGLQDETIGTVDTNGTGFTLAPFKAGAITGTSFSGQILSTNGVVSGSSQIDVASTTGDIALGTRTSGNYVASLVAGTNITLSNNSGEGATPTVGLTNNSITIAGQSTSLGGTVTAETIRTAIGTVVTGSSQITGITNAQLVNSTISGISLGSNLATLTIGTGLSGTSYNGSTGVTIANTGVTSNVAGTGVTVSGATGAVTISIGQSVATNATPTFGNLTINGTITATGDITAFYTSDRRHKNNIQTIPNALDKVKQLNGVTWEWNDDVNEVTKSTPKTGLIAQEVQSVLPEVVIERENGFLALDYSKMIGLLVEAIKEQQTQIEDLKAQLGSK